MSGAFLYRLFLRHNYILYRSRIFTKCSFTTTSVRLSFHENDIKSGYGKKEDLTVEEKMKHVRQGLAQMKHEIKLWKEEMYEKIIDDPYVFMQPGTIDTIWKFNDQSVLDKWVTTSDKDHNEGFSECSLSLNDEKKAIFSGILQTHVPKDGKIKKAGYCNMRSIRPKKSFQREIYHDWQAYTHILLRIRGDGRPYMLNLTTCGSFDVFWNDMYQFVLFTRGGPYWQLAKIPFSKFFLSSKGRVQDKQIPLPLNRITNVGITCGDRLPGPFNLEIDYIAIQYDPSHTEEFAYELYQAPKFIVGV